MSNHCASKHYIKFSIFLIYKSLSLELLRFYQNRPSELLVQLRRAVRPYLGRVRRKVLTRDAGSEHQASGRAQIRGKFADLDKREYAQPPVLAFVDFRWHMLVNSIAN